MVKKYPTKFCSLNPVPTSLLKIFVDLLAAPLASIINLSLTTVFFPSTLKLAYVSPLLKKSSLLMNCQIIDLYLIYHLCQSSSKELFSDRLLIISRRKTCLYQCNLLIGVITQRRLLFCVSWMTCFLPLMMVTVISSHSLISAPPSTPLTTEFYSRGSRPDLVSPVDL